MPHDVGDKCTYQSCAAGYRLSDFGSRDARECTLRDEKVQWSGSARECQGGFAPCKGHCHQENAVDRCAAQVTRHLSSPALLFGLLLWAEIDECKEGTHDCVAPASCKNTPGSFECVCPNGGELTADGTGCECKLTHWVIERQLHKHICTPVLADII